MQQKHSLSRMLFVLLLVLLVALTISLSLTLARSQTGIQAAVLSHLSHTKRNAPLVAGTISEYLIPTPHSEPVGITSGPDGNLWFTESYGNKIGMITTGGQFTEYALPNAESEPENITTGPCGDGTQCLWFTEFAGNRIGKITTGAVGAQITEYALKADSEPEGITLGPDGNLWFTEFDGDSIGKITPGGQITEYLLPDAESEPDGITSGPCDDGTQNQCLWFSENGFTANDTASIGRISTSGSITQYALPTQYARANDITLGPNGVLYFTQQANDNGFSTPSVQANIGQIANNTPAQISEVAQLSNGAGLPNSITEGSDGNLWFTEYYQICSMTPQGITEYPLPAGSNNNLPDVITSGSDGNLWFTEFTGNNIGRITV